MSFLKRLFAGTNLDALLAEAEALAERGELGQAKLTFERSVDRARKERPDAVGAIERRVAECCDGIAEERMGEASRLARAGHFDLARAEFEHALQTAASDVVRARAQTEIDGLERDEVRRDVDGVEPTEDERFELLAGTWEADQHDEYCTLGAPLREALLMLDAGEATKARAKLEALAASATDARYLHFELARARLASNDTGAGRDALTAFLARLGPEQGGDARLVAHMELAAIHSERGDVEAAIAQYQAALEAFADDPRPYLAMGAFFRQQALWDEAVEVLESGLSVLDESRPDFRFWHELGLAHAAAGQHATAIELLERVVSFLTSHGHLDLPPEGTRRLAELHEQTGKPERASDLYAMLAAGSDRPNLGLYHLEAGRLMRGLGLEKEARRMLQRASELVPVEAPEAARLRALLAELG